MKVLIVGSANKWRMERATQRALERVGHRTVLFDDRASKRLLGTSVTQRRALLATRRFKPDFVLLSKCQALSLATVQAIIAGKPNAMWYHDPQWVRETSHSLVAHIIKVARLSEVFFVSGFVDEWKKLGLPAKFLPAAADADLGPTKPRVDFASDVAFIGAGYDPSRAKLLIEVAKHFDLKVWGPGWQEWGKQINWTGRSVEHSAFAAVCSSAKILLGINPEIARGGSNYTSDRTWMTIQAGGFYLGQGTPGLRLLLRGGEHCDWYTTVESCLERCSYYLEHPDMREKIRSQGRRFVSRFHTYDQRVHNLLSGEEFVNPLERV